MIREGRVSANLTEMLPEIRRAVRRVVRGETLVDDIVQECCLRLLQKERLWNPDKGGLKAWVLTVMRHLTFNYLSALWREKARRDSSVTDLSECGGDEAAASADLEGILAGFRDLSSAQRVALILKYYQGLNTEEIAGRLGISRPAVVERLERAIESLRRRSRFEGSPALLAPGTLNLKSCLEGLLMGMKHKVAVTGIVCLLVGAAGVRLATTSALEERERTAAGLAAENRSLKTRLSTLADERIPSLESELARLRSRTGTSVPVKEQALPSPAAANAADPSEAVQRVCRTATEVAQLLGLEPARQKHFAESYERLLTKLLDAEKRVARISREGRELVIHIPPFPEEGGVLREEWSSFLRSSLTSSENDQYARLRADRILFPRDIGLWDRTMVCEPEENSVWPKRHENGNSTWPMFYERWTKPGEKEVDPATRWPWSGSAAFGWYRHLLDPSDFNVDERRR